MTDDRNISTKHQRKGDARKPSDTLDKDRARAPNRKTGAARDAGGNSDEGHDAEPEGGSGILPENEVSGRERSGALDE